MSLTIENATTNGNGAHAADFHNNIQDSGHIWDQFNGNVAAGDAINIHNALISELGKGTIGEMPAKLAIVAALVDGRPVGLGGESSGGKSSTVRMASRLILGLEYEDPDMVAFIPGEHDIAAKQIIGGTVVQKEKVGPEGSKDKTVKEVEREVQGKFTQNTVLAHFEEMTATNPYALRAGMSVFETKTLETASGIVRLPNLQTAFASMNPSRVEDGTFRIPPQISARIIYGAIMGLVDRSEKGRAARLAHNARVRQLPESAEELVIPRISLAWLRGVGDYARSTAVTSGIDSKLGEIAVNVADYLRERHQVREADNRINKHMLRTAKVYGGLRNTSHAVEDADLKDAARSVIAARISTKQSSQEIDLEADVKNVTNLG